MSGAQLNGSPAGIRTPVKGSRVPYAWPLHHGAVPVDRFRDGFINFILPPVPFAGLIIFIRLDGNG